MLIDWLIDWLNDCPNQGVELVGHFCETHHLSLWTESSLLFWTLLHLYLDLLKLDNPALLPHFQCAVDGNASGFNKYFNLSRGETTLVFDFHQRNLP